MQKETIKFLDFLYENKQQEVFFNDIKEIIFQTKSSTSNKLSIFRILEESLNRDLIIPSSFEPIIKNENPINLTFKGKYFIEAVKEKKADKRGLGSLMASNYIPADKREGRGLGHFLDDGMIPKEERKGTGLGHFMKDRITPKWRKERQNSEQD